MKKVIIVGGGACGLFCAYHLLKDPSIEVELYDKNQKPGIKFLVAGKSGLNITHSQSLDTFSKNYFGKEEFFLEWLTMFNNSDLVDWTRDLGVETFVGTSGRIFPKEMKAVDLLSRWMTKLEEHSRFKFFPQSLMNDLSSDKVLINEKWLSFDFCVLALGGASWSRAGSDGKWMPTLRDMGIRVNPFYPMNCGFKLDSFVGALAVDDRLPIKYVEVTTIGHNGAQSIKGDVMFTHDSIEGSPIYFLSYFIQKNPDRRFILVDLLPDWDDKKIRKALVGKKSIGQKLSRILGDRKKRLLKLFLSKEEYLNPEILVEKIKKLEIKLRVANPIDEAISTGGGVCFSEIDKNLRLRKLPKIFVGGEMLDWIAPTGGYLLQGCFSQGFVIAQAIIGKDEN